jgi:hypothetical protein
LRGLILKKGVDAREALGRARERGLLLTIAGGQVLRFTPPLVISEREIEEAVRRLDETLKSPRTTSLPTLTARLPRADASEGSCRPAALPGCAV